MRPSHLNAARDPARPIVAQAREGETTQRAMALVRKSLNGRERLPDAAEGGIAAWTEMRC